MSELKNRAESIERNIIAIVRDLNEQKSKVESLIGEIKYIAEKAEKLEEENSKLQKHLEHMEKEHAREMAASKK